MTRATAWTCPSPLIKELAESDPLLDGRPAGWYWFDPVYVSGRSRDPRCVGPYETLEGALGAYYNYCAAVTI